jgi:hypothetical protein
MLHERYIEGHERVSSFVSLRHVYTANIDYILMCMYEVLYDM